MYDDIMSKVSVSKNELLGAMKANLEKHRKDIEDLNALRRDEISDFCVSMLEQIKKESAQPEIPRFPTPSDNSGEYLKAIKMVEMSVHDTIELTASQFDRLVMDNWEWKKDFAATFLRYSKK